MKRWQKRFDGKKEGPKDPFLEDAPLSDDINTLSDFIKELSEGCSSSAKYDELIEVERPKLFEIATARIGHKCPDPMAHREDVVQQGIQKFLRAVSKRKTNYDDPAKVLHSAVWQEGVRHSQICRREQAFNFNDLSPQSEELSAPRLAGFDSDELTRKTSFNPTEILNDLLDIKERLKNVTDLDLFFMYFQERWTLQEIADKRNCAVMTAQRAVMKLKKELGILDEERPPTPGPKS